MIDPTPIYLGQFSPLKQGDIRDLGMVITDELDGVDTISTAVVTAYLAGTLVSPSPIAADPTVTPTTGVVFRFTAPAVAGGYLFQCVFNLADGQKITRTASINVI